MAGPFAERLLAWFDDHGRKDLPWQQPRTPYRVWISEIMLQQTQVATVIPYFERWMDSFPDVASLAAAPQDDILAHWSGLGYYARARNIHKAAMTCADEHGGEVPTDAEALTALPGIGQSTANAIVSQATDRPAAVLDGNVRRVLARHTATEGWTGSSAVQKKLWKAAGERLPDTRGADYTQAVMDLGALVCTRSKPACCDCPVSDDCRALLNDTVDLLPSPKPSTRVGEKSICMLILRDDQGRILLEKKTGRRNLGRPLEPARGGRPGRDSRIGRNSYRITGFPAPCSAPSQPPETGYPAGPVQPGPRSTGTMLGGTRLVRSRATEITGAAQTRVGTPGPA